MRTAWRIAMLLVLLPASARADSFDVFRPGSVTPMTELDLASLGAGDVLTIGWGRGSFRTYRFDFSGDGFDVSAFEGDGPSQNAFVPSCLEFSPCAAGATTAASGNVRILAIGFDTILDGATYDLTRSEGMFSFASETVTIPASSAARLQLTSPFVFAGGLAISAFDEAASSWLPVFNTLLEGRGLATLTFERDFEQPRYWLSTVRYDFGAEVPEPATLVLFGSGLAALGAVRRRRQARALAKASVRR